MGARRRKLNRELLGIDRADERDDEESFLGSQGSRLLRFLLLMSSSSLSLHASSHSVTAFVYSHNGFSFLSLFERELQNQKQTTTNDGNDSEKGTSKLEKRRAKRSWRFAQSRR
jgi:hypothetical protein